jgi:multidrug efflux system membrane fusion protein
VRLRHCLAAALSLLAAAGLSAGCRGEGDAKAAAQKPGVPVTATAALEQDVPVQVRAIGNVQAYTTVSVLSLVGGELFQVHFKEGQEVRKGDLLFTIDQRPFQAALEQAQATRAQHQAQVAQVEANLARDMAQLENAKVEETRYRKLVEGGFVAREQYDQILTTERTMAATIEADRAAVTNARAVVRADDAMVENARLQLSYTVIRAPFDGRTGNVLIHRGNVIKANDVGNPLVVITQVHPIYVVFSVPEQELDRIKRYRATGELKVEATTPGQPPTTVRGDLTFVNNTVDTATGTIQLKATFQNIENALWPGQFVNVTLTLTTQPRAVVVPTQAVQSGQQGTYVFVVKSDNTVDVRPVTLGITDGKNIVIAKGVAAGEQVVTDGQLRLVPGARVDVKTAPSPAPPSGAGG